MRMDKKNTGIAIAVVLGLIIITGGLLLLAQGGTYELSVIDPSSGGENAVVFVEEYSDFQCPACAATAPIIKAAIAQFPTQVKFVYHDFPLPSHSNARPVAIAALCSAQQGKFSEFHDKVFAEQAEWSARSSVTSYLTDVAEDLDIDQEDFDACRDSRDARNAVQDDVNLGRELAVNSTPSFFVDGELIENPGTVFAWTKLFADKIKAQGIVPENSISADTMEETEKLEE